MAVMIECTLSWYVFYNVSVCFYCTLLCKCKATCDHYLWKVLYFTYCLTCEDGVETWKLLGVKVKIFPQVVRNGVRNGEPMNNVVYFFLTMSSLGSLGKVRTLWRHYIFHTAWECTVIPMYQLSCSAGVCSLLQEVTQGNGNLGVQRVKYF